MGSSFGEHFSVRANHVRYACVCYPESPSVDHNNVSLGMVHYNVLPNGSARFHTQFFLEKRAATLTSQLETVPVVTNVLAASRAQNKF